MSFCICRCSWSEVTQEKIHEGWGSKTELVVSATPLALPLEVSKIQSVAKYLVLSQLNRRLVKIDSSMQYVGDVASSWKVEKEGLIYRFELSQSEKFSDGTLIQPSDIKCSFVRQIKLKSAIHFDFSTIKKVSSGESELTIELKEPNPRLIQQLVHPEFSILTAKDCLKPIDSLKFEVTSGPYFLKSILPEGVLLERNKYFKNFDAPPFLKIINAELNQTEDLLRKGGLDFCMSVGRIRPSLIEEVQNKKMMNVKVPHIGFTYWLSLNPLSYRLKSKVDRVKLASLIKKKIKIKFENKQWANADQLFMPGGTGALKRNVVRDIWRNSPGNYEYLKEGQQLNVLLSKSFPYNANIVEGLQSLPFKFKFTYYNSLQEFEDLLKEKKSFFDMFFINNDFSSMDNFENLKVAFNKNRPLIILGDSSPLVLKNLRVAETSIGGVKDAQSYRKIEEIILKEGLIVPLAYRRLLFLVNSEISIDQWSKYYPEVEFWKIQPKSY